HRPDNPASLSGRLQHAGQNGYPESHRSPPELDYSVWWHRPRHNPFSAFSHRSASPLLAFHPHASPVVATLHVLRHLPEVQVQPHSDQPNQTEWIWINQFPHVEKSGADGTRVNDQHISTPAHDSAILHWQCLYQ